MNGLLHLNAQALSLKLSSGSKILFAKIFGITVIYTSIQSYIDTYNTHTYIHAYIHTCTYIHTTYIHTRMYIPYYDYYF